MDTRRYAAFEGGQPYFQLVRGALGALVDGDHFFDVVAQDIVYELRYEVLDWPRIINGRAKLMEQFKEYCANIELQSADNLVVHKMDDGRGVVIEYEVHGTVRATDVAYNNRFCSIISVANRRITRWRDYMDSLIAWNALTADAHF